MIKWSDEAGCACTHIRTTLQNEAIRCPKRETLRSYVIGKVGCAHTHFRTALRKEAIRCPLHDFYAISNYTRERAVPTPTSEQCCRRELFGARCTIFTQFPIIPESGLCLRPHPNGLTEQSRPVPAVRFHATFDHTRNNLIRRA